MRFFKWFFLLGITLIAICVHNFTASAETAVALSSVCTIVLLYGLLRQPIAGYVAQYIKQFESRIQELISNKEQAAKAVERAVQKEKSTEKQIDEIAHHAHNNIQYLKKNSQKQIAEFKERSGKIFAISAHTQKNQSNTEIKNYITTQVKEQIENFVKSYQFGSNHAKNFQTDLSKLKKFLKNKKHS